MKGFTCADTEEFVMGGNAFPGLDYDFLRYIEVKPENQRRIQGFYLPHFLGRRRVVDLGCGDADFVSLLAERAIDVVGVDSDVKACQVARSRGLPVVERDVFDFLADLPSESVDGIFSAHLVEHLSYPKVIELVRQSFRVLRPGGIVVLATPNARSLFAHLEMFYLHYGHVSFYHPRLLCFFLAHEGFVNASHGENSETASPLLPEARAVSGNYGLLDRLGKRSSQEGSTSQLGDVRRAAEEAEAALSRVALALSDQMPGTVSSSTSSHALDGIAYHRQIPLQGQTPLHHVSYRLKRWLTGWLVEPLLDDQVASLNKVLADNDRAQREWGVRSLSAYQTLCNSLRQTLQLFETSWTSAQDEIKLLRTEIDLLEQEARALHSDTHALAGDLQTLNGAFECYAVAYKPDTKQGI